MRRTLALLLILVLAAGSLGYVHAKLWQVEDDVTVREEVLTGDPGLMDGWTVSIPYTAGNHLRWDLTYTFGPESRTEAPFSLLQPWQNEHPFQKVGSCCNIRMDALYNTLELDQLHAAGYAAPLFQAAAEQLRYALPGESVQLKLADSLEFYPYELYISYRSEQVFSEVMDAEGLNAHNPNTEGFYRDMAERFRFPVPSSATVIATREEFSGRSWITIQPETVIQADFISFMTDDGLYLIPEYLDEDGNSLPMELPDGEGLYLLPWTVVGNTSVTWEADGKTVTTPLSVPDVRAARNLFPLDSDAEVRRILPSPDGKTAWLLLQTEDGMDLCVLNLPDGAVRNRIHLTDAVPSETHPACTSLLRENLLLAAVGDRLALVNLDGDARLEFEVPAGEGEWILHHLAGDQPLLHYEDGVLRILDRGLPRPDTGYVYTQAECSFTVLAYTADGLQFHGNYHCNLDDSPQRIVHFVPSNHHQPFSLSH